MLAPGIRPFVAAALAGVIVLGVAGPVVAAPFDVRCRGDECDDGRWGAARGPGNENGYWGMFAGHNCTNYVAWRLIDAGVPEPRLRLGNASTWAERAEAMGVVVDHIPEAGAVAQWDGDAGMGSAGHVAFIEEVYEDGTMLISEDYWRGGSQTGLLTYRTIAVDSVSNIIHFQGVDTALRVRQALLGAAGVEESTVQYDVPPELLTATSTESGTPLLLATVAGRVVELSSGDPATMIDTGIATTATSLAAVSRGAASYLMTVDHDTLTMNLRTPDGWTQMPTGLEGIVGDIAVVDEGTITPTVLLSQADSLYVVYMDTEGWHVYTTGISLTGPIRAGIVDGQLAVFSVTDGVVMHTWWDGVSWRQESTGVAADSVAGVSVADGRMTVFLIVSKGISSLTATDAGWVTTDLGLRAGTSVATTVAGGAPVVYQVG